VIEQSRDWQLTLEVGEVHEGWLVRRLKQRRWARREMVAGGPRLG
jgi:hypothetical protein